LITGTVSAGEEISGATGIVVEVVVVVVDVVDVVVVLVGVVVVVGALLLPEHAARERHNPATTIAFFDIFLISLRYLI
jgi:hypothetical protein